MNPPADLGAALDTAEIDTSAGPPERRLAYWQEQLAPDFELRLPPQAAAGSARSQSTLWRLGRLVVMASTHCAHEIERSAKQVRLGVLDHYVLHLRIHGEPSCIEEAGQSCRVAAGELGLTHLLRQHRLVLPDGQTITLFVPREMLSAGLPLQIATPLRLASAGAAELLRARLVELSAVLPALRARDGGALEPVLVALLSAALAGAAAAASEGGTDRPHEAVQAGILAFIDARLGDAQLSAQQICAQFAMSRATLYRLFEPHGGVARFIRDRRLARVHAAISRPGRRHHLDRLAVEHGLGGIKQLSRAYRERYGHAPSAAEGREHEAAVRAPRVGTLAHWLRASQAGT